MASSAAAYISIDGGDSISVEALEVYERLSEVPRYDVTIPLTTDSLDRFIGKPVEITLPEPQVDYSVTPRTFEGIVTQAELVADTSNTTSDGSTVLLTVQPFLILLGYSSYCGIYQKKSSIDILQDVLKRNGLDSANLTISAQPPTRDTCIQYNENDLTFCQRLLAEDGIVFYFHDGSDGDTLVLHDSAKPFPDNTTGTAELTDSGAPDSQTFQARRLSLGQKLVSGKVTLASFDVDRVAQSLGGPVTSTNVTMSEKPATVEYRASRNATIENDAKVAGRRIQGSENFLHGQTSHPGLYLGQTLQITDAVDTAMKGEYVISDLEVRSGVGAESVRFRAAPTDTPYLPPLMPKPLIPGVHNARVVGDDDGAPACDASGRVKVKFFWDTTSETEDTSGYIRVAQSFAGAKYGSQFIPRAGHEVLVSFLHGDPDAPVITGRLYNGKNTPPYGTANTTQSGIVTKLKGNSNELMFDDKQDAELLALRAAKDFELSVTEKSDRTIGTDETTTVKGNSTMKVEKACDMDVTDAMTLDADTITLTGQTSLTLKVGGSSIELTSSGIDIKTTTLTLSSTNLTAEGSGQYKLTGAQGTVEATGTLSLKGLQLSAEGSVTAEVKGGATATVEGSGMTEIKGGLVKIN